MIVCSFIGTSAPLDQRLEGVVTTALEKLMEPGGDFTFCSRSYTEFEKLCEQALYRIKRKTRREGRQNLTIDMLSVQPQMEQYSSDDEPYDRPRPGEAPSGALSKIEKCHRWMIDRSDVVLTHVLSEWDGDYSALQYAKTRSALTIIRIDPPPSL